MKIPGINWTHDELNVQTSGQVLNCVHTAVAAGLDRWETFMSFTIPTGMRAKLVFLTPMRYKQYDALGEEQARATQMMLGLQKVGKSFVTEIAPIPYSNWYDIPWLDQLNSDNRDAISVDLGIITEVGFYEHEQIVFQVKNSSIAIPVAPHESTLLSYPVQVITTADLARQIKLIEDAKMRARGIDVAD